jgi:hypothetical protein
MGAVAAEFCYGPCLILKLKWSVLEYNLSGKELQRQLDTTLTSHQTGTYLTCRNAIKLTLAISLREDGILHERRQLLLHQSVSYARGQDHPRPSKKSLFPNPLWDRLNAGSHVDTD